MRTKWSQRVFAALTSLAILGGLSAATAVDPALGAGQTQDQFYDVKKVFTTYMTVPQASIDALNKDPKTYVSAQVQFKTPDGQQSPLMLVGIRLKGTTSFSTFDRFPSFKVKFNWGTKTKQRFLGLKEFTLNYMTQDTSQIHEASAYRLYNLMGVVAPRAGYSRVYINGTYRSLYVNVERPDDIFLSTRFADATQHLYEGVAWKDFKSGSDNGGEKDGNFLVDEGWKTTPSKADLTKAIQIANGKVSATWWTNMDKYFDRSKLVMMFAVDNFIGNWDSYSGPIINNYFARSNSNGRFTLIPWGTDQTFGENRQTVKLLDDYFFAVDQPSVAFPWINLPDFHGAKTLARGVLFRQCLAYATCKTLYLNDLKKVIATVQSSKLTNWMSTLSTTLAPYTNSGTKAEQKRTIGWIAKQTALVQAVLAKNGIK